MLQPQRQRRAWTAGGTVHGRPSSKIFRTAKAGDDDTYGSHSTLRIGRPEHKSFDLSGTRAWRAVAIFSRRAIQRTPVRAAVSTHIQISIRGRMNINTASREALRSLGAGIQIGKLNAVDVDQGIQPATVYGPTNTSAGDLFADAVIAQRKKSSHLFPISIGRIERSPTAKLFLKSRTSSPPMAPANGMERRRKRRIFRKDLFNYTTIRGRNFRIFVTGQAYVPPTGTPTRAR